MSRASMLLLREVSGLDVTDASTLPILQNQFSSPPGNDLQNNKGLQLAPGTKFLRNGWVETSKPQGTQLRNATQSPVGYVDQNTNTNPYSGSTVYDESFFSSRSGYLLREWFHKKSDSSSQEKEEVDKIVKQYPHSKKILRGHVERTFAVMVSTHPRHIKNQLHRESGQRSADDLMKYLTRKGLSREDAHHHGGLLIKHLDHVLRGE